MWTAVYFKSFAEQEAWIEKNNHRYQIVQLFVNNGYAVEGLGE